LIPVLKYVQPPSDPLATTDYYVHNAMTIIQVVRIARSNDMHLVGLIDNFCDIQSMVSFGVGRYDLKMQGGG